MDIVQSGIIETEEQIMELANSCGHVVIPSEDEDLELTHWWRILDDGVETLYMGTPETFTRYVEENNGGVQ